MNELIQTDRFLGERDTSRLCPREQSQALHDFREALDLIELAGEDFPLRGCCSRIAKGGFDFAMQDGERSFEFVRGMQCKLTDLSERSFQTACHSIQDLGQPVNFISSSGSWHSLVEVVGVDPLSRQG